MGKAILQPTASLNECSDCSYCRSTSLLHFLFSGRRYYRCSSCDLIFAERKTDGNATLAYYQERYFDEYSDDQRSGQRARIYRQILDLLEENQNKGWLLDIGCGCGLFLAEAQKRRWLIFGLDPSRHSIADAMSRIGDQVICGTVDDLPIDRHYNAIVMINVLDHVIEGWRQLKKIHQLLVPGGILYLRFPNGVFHSSVLQFFRMISAERFVKPILIFHEYAFTPKAIRRYLRDAGFVDVQILNAPLTGGRMDADDQNFVRLFRIMLINLVAAFFNSLAYWSGGRWVWGPSLQVIARKGTVACLS